MRSWDDPGIHWNAKQPRNKQDRTVYIAVYNAPGFVDWQVQFGHTPTLASTDEELDRQLLTQTDRKRRTVGLGKMKVGEGWMRGWSREKGSVGCTEETGRFI